MSNPTPEDTEEAPKVYCELETPLIVKLPSDTMEVALMVKVA